MSDVVCTKPQEEYEDDFEKDLDWLISEESRSDDQGPDYEDIEAEIDKELEEDVKVQGTKQKKQTQKEEKGSNKTESIEEEEERWPSPMEPLECESDRDSPCKSSPTAPSPTAPPPPALDDQTDEEKKYILEKIREANRELRDQKAPDMPRRRRLHFKDTLVDLVVPPLEYEQHGAPSTDRAKDAETESEVSEKLSELQISPREESRGEGSSLGSGSGRVGGGAGAGESSQGKEGRVLVEKDGKFDWVNLNEVESQGLLPPLANNYSDNSHSSHRPQEPSKIHSSSSSPRPLATSSFSHQGIEHLRAPKPPSQPRNRPNSANHSQHGSQRRGSKRRVQSATDTPFQATETPCQSTYSLSPQQKELLQKIQERKDRLAREAELRKQEEEEQKRQENEIAFRAWLMRKQDQLQEEKRIQRAQEMEKMNSRKDPTSDPDEAFRLWLQRKQEQQQRERQLEEMKRLEQEGGCILRNREEGERAFKLWLKQKQAEKRAEQQAVRERSRRRVLELRRARRMQDLLSAVKPFRFNEQWTYRF